MTEEQKRKKREREIERQNSIPVIAQTTPQILFLETKLFVILMDSLFQVDSYFKKVV